MRKNFSFIMILILMLSIANPINIPAQTLELNLDEPVYAISIDFDNGSNQSVNETVYSAKSMKLSSKVEGSYLVEPTLDYEEVYSFYNGMARVYKNNKYGFIDKSGNEIIKPVYDSVYSIDTSGMLVVIDSEFNYVDTKGNILTKFNYDDMKGFSGGLAAARKNGKYGFINKNTETIIPFIYDDVKQFYSDINLIAVKKDGKWGVIDKSGNQIADFKYDDVDQYFSENMILVKENNRWGCLDAKGNKIIECIYRELYTFSDGLVAAKDENWNWGFIDSTGNIVIDFLYDDVSNISTYGRNDAHGFRNGLVGVEKDGSWGFIDSTGNVVVDFEYSYALAAIFENVLMVGDDYGYFGFIDRKGNKLTEFIYGGNCVFSDTTITLPKDGKYGCLDKECKEVVPFIYENRFVFSDEVSAVKLNDKWGIIKNPSLVNEDEPNKNYRPTYPNNNQEDTNKDNTINNSGTTSTGGGSSSSSKKKDSIQTNINPIDTVKDKTTAISVIKDAITKLTPTQKNSIYDIDRLILMSEEAIARANTIDISDDELIITDDLIKSVNSEAEKLKSEIINLFEENSINIFRKMNTNVMFSAKTSNKIRVTFDKSMLNTTIDNVKVKTNFTEITVDRAKLLDTVKVTLSNNLSKVNINFDTDLTTILKVSFPTLDGNVNYMAVTDANGNLVGGKYNPITQLIEAKINKSGLFNVIFNEKDFEDIKNKSAQMQEAIKILASKGMINGTAELQFSPDTPISRAEVASIILSTLAKLDLNEDGKFEDVTKSNWYFGVAGSSKKYGLIAGYPDNTFRGENIIPKEQIVSLASRTLKAEMEYKVPTDIQQYLNYEDKDDIAKWSEEDIALATMVNLVPKRTDNRFEPNSQMTRGDAAIILKQLFDKIW